MPDSLDDLKELVDETVFIQPPTGDPIGFRADRHGIVIYHWGEDGDDDGGDVEPIDAHLPKDWGIRIPW